MGVDAGLLNEAEDQKEQAVNVAAQKMVDDEKEAADRELAEQAAAQEEYERKKSAAEGALREGRGGGRSHGLFSVEARRGLAVADFQC